MQFNLFTLRLITLDAAGKAIFYVALAVFIHCPAIHEALTVVSGAFLAMRMHACTIKMKTSAERLSKYLCWFRAPSRDERNCAVAPWKRGARLSQQAMHHDRRFLISPHQHRSRKLNKEVSEARPALFDFGSKIYYCGSGERLSLSFVVGGKERLGRKGSDGMTTRR